ncbi:hypothetical protein BHE74_00016415 [Ensete ventricosum]|nr:hypothetical protein GW17_00003895 [Ensete ventricosum]RWW75551.1 hypothetical protein BHE74_00016415 [Ensete ventricosum]
MSDRITRRYRPSDPSPQVASLVSAPPPLPSPSSHDEAEAVASNERRTTGDRKEKGIDGGRRADRPGRGTGIRYATVAEDEERGAGGTGGRVLGKGYFRVYEEGAGPEESLKEQVTGFVVATGEMLRELGRGFWDVAQQSLEGVGETYVGKKVRGHWDAVLRRLEFVNEYLPEDRDPVHAWPIVITVFLLALLGFGESDPHPVRNLNSSAMDMLHLANAHGVTEKFWMVGYSGGAMHAWAAVHYIPDRLAGVFCLYSSCTVITLPYQICRHGSS